MKKAIFTSAIFALLSLAAFGNFFKDLSKEVVSDIKTAAKIEAKDSAENAAAKLDEKSGNKFSGTASVKKLLDDAKVPLKKLKASGKYSVTEIKTASDELAKIDVSRCPDAVKEKYAAFAKECAALSSQMESVYKQAELSNDTTVKEAIKTLVFKPLLGKQLIDSSDGLAKSATSLAKSLLSACLE